MAQRGVMADVMHHAKMEAKHDLEKQGALGSSGSYRLTFRCIGQIPIA